jgi:hypothetical protein
MLFAAQSSSGNFGVSVDGQPVAFTPVSSRANYTLYSVDMRAWAGQSTTLMFTAFANASDPGAVNFLFLDSISFSTTAVPEPTTHALGLMGVGAFLSRKLFKVKR